MRARTKNILLVVLLILVAAVIVAAVVLRPYYRMPPEPKQELDAQLTEYQAIVTAMASRPPADRLALDALLGEMEALRDKGAKNLWLDDCPSYTTEFLEARRPQIEKLLAFENRFAAILAGGFVFQHDGRFDTDFPNFFFLRNFSSAQLAAAVTDLQQGRAEQAFGRFDAVTQIIEGLEKTPTLLCVLVGVSIEERLNEAIVYLLPSLTEDQATKLRAIIAGYPDARSMMIAAMKVEVAAFASLLDRTRTEDTSKLWDYVKHPDSTTPSRFWVRLAKFTGYLTRERYTYLSLTGRQIGYLEKWLAGGAEGQPESLKKEEILHSPATMLALPNLPSLMMKVQEKTQQREAVLTAIDLELKRRSSDQKTDIELPYGKDEKIVLKTEYGCIVKPQ